MSGSPVATYQSALKELAAAEHRAEAVVRVITDAADKLRNWRRVMIANGSGGFPPAIGLRIDSPSIDARGWPSADQLEQALVSWHIAHEAAVTAWNALAPGERTGLRPPPELPPI
jgi:hypothetical protein